MLNILIVLVTIAAFTAVYMAAVSWRVRQRALRRLYADEELAGPAVESSGSDTPLGRWLARAGYRRSSAPRTFITATGGCAFGGFVISQVYDVFLLGTLLDMVANVPGSAGDMIALILQSGSSILFIAAALVPTLAVRTARRARVQTIERDLPLALELFATMAEAGLGFDAALAKIVRAQGNDGGLGSEFINFQHDIAGGIPRTQALRQLGRRVDIPSLTSFTSALIQAEQVGASLAETLQHQAVDLRQRRRENALLQAQALPVKLVFPLVVCFLPGIFISTLAPVLYQMVQVANGVLRSAGR